MNDLDKTQISSWIETYQELNAEQLHTVLDTVKNCYRKNLVNKKVLEAQCEAIFIILNDMTRITALGWCIAQDLNEYLKEF